LRWSVEDGVLTPESVAITGGRAAYSSNGWAANYYITDHLGSVRAVTDAEGEVLDTFDYMPYGSEISSRSSTTTDYRFTGKERQSMVNNSIYDSFARFQNTYGRFMSIDPKAESFYHISPYTYCAGDPVNLVDPDGEAWKPTMHTNLIDGTSYYTGFEWIDESESYDENGNLKQGLFRQAIFFSDNMTFDSSNVYNIGSSTAYVYLEDRKVVTYDACTHPSGPNYPTIPEKLVEATYGKHNNKYDALRMHDFGNELSQIYLGFENPAHKGRYYIEGANIHKAGINNRTGMTTDNKPISAGCFLIDINKWESFMSHFNSSSIVGVVASRNRVKIPINQNTCEFRIIPFTYELFD
jgi:RHS repeat-associated protein